METKTYTTIDRKAAEWPSGVWDTEPDKVQWPDAATGLPCLAVRNRHSGNWCGYVGLPPEHPLHGKGYDDLGIDVDVHGGLTFSDKCRPGENEAQGICHVPGPGEPDHVWWLGFDCAHCCDYSPRDVHYAATKGWPFTLDHNSSYRTLRYVQRQCANLAKQLQSCDTPPVIPG